MLLFYKFLFYISFLISILKIMILLIKHMLDLYVFTARLHFSPVNQGNEYKLVIMGMYAGTA